MANAWASGAWASGAWAVGAWGATGIIEQWSFDRGRTWSTPTVAILNGSYPRIAINSRNNILRMAYVGGDKTLRGTYQGSGDTAQSAVFVAQWWNPATSSLVDFELADSTFDIVGAHEGLWLLSCVVFGESSTSDWFSSDNGRTWRRIV